MKNILSESKNKFLSSSSDKCLTKIERNFCLKSRLEQEMNVKYVLLRLWQCNNQIFFKEIFDSFWLANSDSEWGYHNETLSHL